MHPRQMPQLVRRLAEPSLGPQDIPSHFPPCYFGLQPWLQTPRDADHSRCLLLGTAPNCCLSVPRIAGFSSCAGRGRCLVTPGREAYGPVAYIWVGSLTHVRISLESLSLHIRASRQKLTCIYSTRMRTQLNFRIRRVPLAWIVLKRTIHLNVIKASMLHIRRLIRSIRVSIGRA